MEVAAYGSKAEKAVQETKGRIKALENQLSRTKADSDVSRVNHNGTTPTTGLTYGMRALLPAALEYRDATNGAFDITIAPVMDAWGFTGDQLSRSGAVRTGRAAESTSTAMRSKFRKSRPIP